MAAGAVKTSRGSQPLWAAAAALLAVAAYGPVVWGSTAADLNRRVVEGWFFDPGQLPAGMVIAVAGWLAWRRRAALAALTPGAHLGALPLLLLGLACATLVGQALGKSDVEDAFQWAWDVAKITMVLLTVLGLPMWLLTDIVSSIFIHE